MASITECRTSAAVLWMFYFTLWQKFSLQTHDKSKVIKETSGSYSVIEYSNANGKWTRC
jgi:hypothetical protein